MQRHTLFTGWKTQHRKAVNSPTSIDRFNSLPMKTPEEFFCRNRQDFLTLMWKCKETRIANTVLKKKVRWEDSVSLILRPIIM